MTFPTHLAARARFKRMKARATRHDQIETPPGKEAVPKDGI
jgi:hypothetical protein